MIKFGSLRVNSVRGSKTESMEHFLMKAKLCKLIMDKGYEFITEAIFEKSVNMKSEYRRADIFITDNFTVIEVYNKEKQESIEKKRKYYKNKNLNFYAISTEADDNEIYNLARCL